MGRNDSLSGINNLFILELTTVCNRCDTCLDWIKDQKAIRQWVKKLKREKEKEKV